MDQDSKIELIARRIKLELSKPRLTEVKKTYLLEKLRLLGEYVLHSRK